MTVPSSEFAARVTEEATPWSPAVPEDAAVSARPELDGVTAQTVQQVEGVDTESMPGLKDMSRSLPSERMRIQGAMMQVVQALPKEWIEAGSNDIEAMLLDGGLEELDPNALVAMFEQMEGLVFQLAEDEGAMREWIVSQDSSMDALVYAFNRVSSTVGN